MVQLMHKLHGRLVEDPNANLFDSTSEESDDQEWIDNDHKMGEEELKQWLIDHDAYIEENDWT